jgi:histidinol-phosphate/aromatic aminotransferase/cobyric acid decarboxylase-like protein
VISQQNPHLLSAVSFLTTSHVNTIASLYLSSLLTWSQLPTLLKLNSERLTTSYRLLADALRKWNIDFVTPTHGLFLFAKLAKHARNATAEREVFDELAVSGVRVGERSGFKGVEGEYGWARVRFSVDVETMLKALGRMEKVLAS